MKVSNILLLDELKKLRNKEIDKANNSLKIEEIKNVLSKKITIFNFKKNMNLLKKIVE